MASSRGKGESEPLTLGQALAAHLNEESAMDIEAIEKDAVVLTRYQIYLTQAHDGILLTLYGDDSAGNAREIATVVMHPNGAEEIATSRGLKWLT